MSYLKTGVIVGGTGAQGGAVVRHLASLNKYHLKVLTRNPDAKSALSLKELPHVELVQTSPAGHDEASFLSAAKDADFAFINTDGFSIGEVAETYWGIRFYELARIAKVRHFIYSSLANIQEGTEYDESLRPGFWSGKWRVVDFLRSKPTSIDTGKTYWSVITSGPYMEMLHETLLPVVEANGTAIFRLPLNDGAIPFIHLGDFGRYVEYSLSHPSAVAGTELKIATVHASGTDIVEAFTKVTGQPARYQNIPVEHWIKAGFASLPRGSDTPIGLGMLRGGPLDADIEKFMFPLTFAEDMKRFWNLWKHSAGNKGVVTRDYDQLDRILPDRVKSVEEWMRKVEYTAERKELLKVNEKK